jgi:histidinol-phosphate aminotransferase
VREFDNLVVLQTLETWAGLAGLPVAYAIAPPPLVRQLARFGRSSGITAAAVTAGLATMDDIAYVRATVQRVREERNRLYRMLRKLNMLRPVPSLANFVLAHVERGTASYFVEALAEQGIRVNVPSDPQLSDYLRFSAISPEATDRLKVALIEIAAQLPD